MVRNDARLKTPSVIDKHHACRLQEVQTFALCMDGLWDRTREKDREGERETHRERES